MVIRGYNNFLAGRLVRYGASVEHGPEIYGVYLCNNLDKVNRGDTSASLFMGVDSTFQYSDVEAATADWRGAVRPNPFVDSGLTYSLEIVKSTALNPFFEFDNEQDCF